MDFSTLTMAQKKMLGAAAACLLYVIAIFLPYHGVSVEGLGTTVSSSSSGMDMLPAGWLWLVMGLGALAIFALLGLGRDVPVPVPPFALAFYLISVPFWLHLSYLLEGVDGLKIGFWLALLASAAAAVMAIIIGREEEG